MKAVIISLCIVILGFGVFFAVQEFHFLVDDPAKQSFADNLQQAEEGLIRDQLILAYLYTTGDGIPENEEMAAYWNAEAAKQGNLYAMVSLGICYFNGEGVQKDLIQAADLFHKAAVGGLAVAQYNLGLCYAYGDGVPLDRETAIH